MLLPHTKVQIELRSNFTRVKFWWISFILSACGNNNRDSALTEILPLGFDANYAPPISSIDLPKEIDPYFKLLEPVLSDPYWILTLEMDESENIIDQMLLENDRSIKFSFPTEVPEYLSISITGWAPPSESMVSAGREVFLKLNQILDVRFEESDTFEGFNNLVIAQSIQANTSGFSYFPNNYYQLGSDIFISKDYSEPLILPSSYTNYDYETLVHEIGHALGLKHPFEGHLNNFSILNAYEDQTKFTAMSYDDDPYTFDGTFRVLDWMTLTKYYGVNQTFRSEDDVYTFDDKSAVFIIDGNGLDAINSPNSTQNIFLDLRQGGHSYEGQKSTYITAAKQLTISHGSNIENVQTGSGNDTVIGNDLPNIINSGDGDDVIFAGEGEDIVYSGAGKDTIDLSEDLNVIDIIVLQETSGEQYYDTVYGFTQGISGDVLDISDLDLPSLTSLPLVDSLNVPFGYIDNCLVQVFGKDLSDVNSVTDAFRYSGDLEKLQLSSGKKSVLITSGSQETGDAQNVYYIQQNIDILEVQHLFQLVGNYLDIDSWSIDNFLV